MWTETPVSAAAVARLDTKSLAFAPWANMALTLTSVHDGDAGIATPEGKVDYFATVASRRRRRRHRSSSLSTRSALRIMFVGDSQARTVYRHLEAVLDNRPVIHSKDFAMSAPKTRGKTHAGLPPAPPPSSGLEGYYLWDPYLERFANQTADLGDMIALRNFRRGGASAVAAAGAAAGGDGDGDNDASSFPDVVLLSVGPWPASFGQWSFARMYDHMTNASRAIARFRRSPATTPWKDQQQQQRQRNRVRFVWYGAFAWPKPRKMPGFRITNARLRLFSLLGELAMSQAGPGGSSHDSSLAVVASSDEAWHWTAGVARKYHRGDHMHFSSAVLFEVLRRMLTRLRWD